MELARFYLQPRRDPHGPTLALFVASLPPSLSEKSYETILVEFLGAGMYAHVIPNSRYRGYTLQVSLIN